MSKSADLKKETRKGERKGGNKGSITAEASISLSLFLLFFLMMIFFYLLLNLEMKMQNAIENAADIQMVYMLMRNEGLDRESGSDPASDSESNPVPSAPFEKLRLDTVFLKQYVIAELGGSYLDSCWIRGGRGGLDFGKSSFLEDGEAIRIVVSYHIRIPFWGIRDIRMMQSAERRIWIGADSSSRDLKTGKTVYLAEEGSVYHLYEDCSYIHVKLEAVSFQSLDKLRNADGHIYYPCQSCKPEASGWVYISRYGERYHAVKTCKAIKKTCRSVSLEEAGSRKLCSKCAQRAGK